MFCYTPNLKIEKRNAKKLRKARFQGVRPDHEQVEGSNCCFPRELVSFVRPRELVSFDPWHVTRSLPIGKRT